MELNNLYPGRELSLDQIVKLLKKAIDKRKAFSLIRLGDGEMRALGYDIFKPLKLMSFQFDYAGVKLPNETIRKELVQSIKEADIVGCLPPEKAGFLPEVFRHFKIKPRFICRFSINWKLHGDGEGPLYDLLSNQRVFLVNRHVEEAINPLKRLGVNISGYTHFEGYSDLPRVLKILEKKRETFDVLLASVGIPAIRLCPVVAKSFKKVAIDYGHVIERVMDPSFDRYKLPALKDTWREEKKRSLVNDGTLIKGSRREIYFIHKGAKHHITSLKVFKKLGFKREDVLIVRDKELSYYPDGNPIEKIEDRP